VNRVFESTHPSDIFIYVWLLRNEKPASHRRRVMIVDARQQFEKEPKSSGNKRNRIVSALGTQLTAQFGRGFSRRNLFNMVRFAEVFPDPRIVQPLAAQLSWTHFSLIIYLDDPLQRDFYAEMCRIERWNKRTLRQKINGMLYERTALSRKPEKLTALELKQLREEDKLTPDLVFRDPYILELGVGFCFVARQQRTQIDDRDYYLDLLFYHRKLRRLIAIDLKLGKFEAADKGQMEPYLGWLKRYACEPDGAAPLGMILCAGKSEEHIALLELQKSGIHVAGYWTEALPKKELERKLHQAVRLARARRPAHIYGSGPSRLLTSGRRQSRHVEPRPVSFRVPEVILKLLVEPAFSAGAEGDRETDRHLRADTRTPVKNTRQRLPTHAERPRGVRNGQVQGFQAQLPEHLTGVRRIMHLHGHLNGNPRSLRDLRPSRHK
jgi:predicted nuclease of restriction endonuclease-like (RecB) superfamily